MPGIGDAQGNFLKSDEVCRCFIALNTLIFSGSEASRESNIEGNVQLAIRRKHEMQRVRGQTSHDQ